MPRESSNSHPKIIGRTLKIQDPSTENGLSTWTVRPCVKNALKCCQSGLNSQCSGYDTSALRFPTNKRNGADQLD